ncbi:MAG: sensor histidine kinase [Bacteroidales bacterium]|nr:sensor histidine kinase [Bacteroidales bacterium]
MRNLLILLLSFFFLYNSFGQYNTDSLEMLLEGANDSLRASLLYKISKEDYNSSPEKCLRYARESALIAEKLENPALQAMSFQIIGVIYKNRGAYDSAMNYQVKAVKILEEVGNEQMLASSYNDLGVLNKNLGNYDKAVEYYKKSLAILEKMGIERYSALLLSNIGTIFDAKEELDSAEYYYKLALDIHQRIDDPGGRALSLNNLGELYAKRKDHKKALDYFHQTLDLDILTQNKMGMIYSYLNLGNAYFESGNNHLSLKHFKAAEKIADSLDAMPLLSNIYKGVSNVYENMGQYETSLKYFKEYNNLDDSVYNENKTKQIEEIQTRYETEKKEAEILLLSQENELRQIRNKEQKGQIILLVLGIVLIVGIGSFLLYRNRNKHKSVLQEERIKQKEEGLKAVFTAQEEERKRIAKELHDGIGQTLSGLRLSWGGFSGQISTSLPDKTAELNRLSKILDDACSEVRTISHQMMPRQLTEVGLVPSIRDMLDNSLGNTSVDFDFEHYGVDGRFPENVELALYRITQELVNNVIKHSGADKLAVQLIKSNNNLVLIVEDNGRGFDPESDKSSGIGLMNIASRIDTINGEINYEPSPGSGTVATIRVPV